MIIGGFISVIFTWLLGCRDYRGDGPVQRLLLPATLLPQAHPSHRHICQANGNVSADVVFSSVYPAWKNNYCLQNSRLHGSHYLSGLLKWWCRFYNRYLSMRWEDFSLKKKIQKILVVSNITCRKKLPEVSESVIMNFPNLLTRFYWRSQIKINVVKISVLDSILRLIPRPPGSGSGSFPLPDANSKIYFSSTIHNRRYLTKLYDTS